MTFNFHKVRGCVLLDLIALYRTGHLYGAAEQQQFFGQGGLTGIRMANNTESPPLRYFVLK